MLHQKLTLAATASCWPSESPCHHRPNSSVHSTSQGMAVSYSKYGIYRKRQTDASAIRNGPSGTRAQAPSQSRRFVQGFGVHYPVYRRMSEAANCGLGDSVAETGVNGAAC